MIEYKQLYPLVSSLVNNLLNNKYIKILLFIGIILLILSLITVIASQGKMNGIKNNSSESSKKGPIFINNDNCPDFVKATKNYDISPLFESTNGLETAKNVIETTDGNRNYTFETEYFLPMNWRGVKDTGTNEYWYNCQAISIQGKYMYVLTSSGHDLNKGFIVRYDMDILNKYNISTNNSSSMRDLGYDLEYNNYLTKNQKAIKKAIKVGPIFNTGHGQSLSYNSKDNSMWMWQDDGSNKSIRLMSIDMDKLKPNKTYNLSVNYKNHKIKQFRNLAFDKDGNFYADYTKKSTKNSNGSSLIFKGKVLNDTSVKIEHLGTVKNRPGTYSQSLAINPTTNRMYLVSDGAFYTVPVDELNNKTVSKDDFHYSIFDTNREFEGVSFDDEGNSYLLALRGTEVLKSTEVYY